MVHLYSCYPTVSSLADWVLITPESTWLITPEFYLPQVMEAEIIVLFVKADIVKTELNAVVD